MAWRQTTLFPWLPRRQAPVGSSAANPIEIPDDDVDGSTDNLQLRGADATEPIVISDDEGSGAAENQARHHEEDQDDDDTPSEQFASDEGNEAAENQAHHHEEDQGYGGTPPEQATSDDDGRGATQNQVRHHEEAQDHGETPPEQLANHWPPRQPYWDHNRNPWDVKFPDLDFGMCDCSRICPRRHCKNAKADIFCDDTNCRAGASCTNRLKDLGSLVLIPCIKGLGVMTTADIPKGAVLGEYCGKIIPHTALTEKEIAGGFVLEFFSNSSDESPVYIDARPGGSLCRFINHSCSPNCRFDEFALHTTRRMVITARKRIRAGEEITVKYSAKAPFTCLCGEANCTSRRT